MDVGKGIPGREDHDKGPSVWWHLGAIGSGWEAADGEYENIITLHAYCVPGPG